MSTRSRQGVIYLIEYTIVRCLFSYSHLLIIIKSYIQERTNEFLTVPAVGLSCFVCMLYHISGLRLIYIMLRDGEKAPLYLLLFFSSMTKAVSFFWGGGWGSNEGVD